MTPYTGKRVWKRLHAFVTSKAEDSLEIAPDIPVWNKDPFMLKEESKGAYSTIRTI